MQKVELGGSEPSSVGCEMAVREAVGREDSVQSEDDASCLQFMGSIVDEASSILRSKVLVF